MSSSSTPLKKSLSKNKASPTSSNVRKASSITPSNSNNDELFRVNFEVRGKVQGVHFRKYTQSKGTSLGLRGWCQNTEYNTVIGCMEGPRTKIDQMKKWLQTTGSPKSIISGVEFKETRSGPYTLAAGFQIVK